MLRYLFSRSFTNLTITALLLSGIWLGISYFGVGARTGATSHITPQLKIHPIYRHIGASKQNIAPFSCQITTPPTCYGPQQIHKAYNIQPLLDGGTTGQGQTIVIIDAFQAPKIKNDLHVFDQTFGLNDPTLNIIAPDGLTPFDPSNPTHIQWSAEITLDVEWAHAIAPDATIDLVLAKSGEDADILSVIKYAIDNNLGAVINMSFGEAESCVSQQILKQEHALFFEAAYKGITLVTASNDSGAAQATCDGNSYFLSTGYPASDPLVTAVGGTKLDTNGPAGDYKSEVTWNEINSQGVNGASGGGFSTIYAKPFYQYATAGIDKFRGVPDVAYNAALNSGFLVVWSSPIFGDNQIIAAAGTSAGAPQWSAIVALGCQLNNGRLGFINPALYLFGHSKFYTQAFHDITSGNNTFVGTDSKGNSVTIQGYDAKAGWDPATGWGSPNVANLLAPFVEFAASKARDRDSQLASLK
ncbi:hypothetical protein EPA93_16395 [Ktedonosporobacter rubrisoli]|uniref:Peptidase S53 domain-containing protein n=1 Tax=Ktedonosporobacter rubrisoli TaxID=2509675 RepID=A0A4P6JQC9_KTERU|nr:S53 family peptidase [Ktedonosporobacter rubrisoli]QBD77484.1 hypothetical protein EPA93_16395 [Ktedonosporobacter rubrisoli]